VKARVDSSGETLSPQEIASEEEEDLGETSGKKKMEKVTPGSSRLRRRGALGWGASEESEIRETRPKGKTTFSGSELSLGKSSSGLTY